MIRKYDGVDLEKILIHFGLIDVCESVKTKIICPFHGDTDPSMSINFSSGEFYCFGCGVRGNACDFIQLVYPEKDRLDCMLELERIVHSDKIEKLHVQRKVSKRKNYNHLLCVAEDYFYGLKRVDWNHIQTEEQEQVLLYMKERGFCESDLNVADCRVSCNWSHPVIFPILDNGRFCGYVCRAINEEHEKNGKYMYNEGFRKRYVLCGRYEEEKILFVCEGYLDYLSLKTRGKLKNVVAFLGWHMSDEQCKKIKEKGITKIVCCLDNKNLDESGKKGYELLKKHFDTVISFPYPEGVKDPGEMDSCEIKRALRRVKNEIVL